MLLELQLLPCLQGMASPTSRISVRLSGLGMTGQGNAKHGRGGRAARAAGGRAGPPLQDGDTRTRDARPYGRQGTRCNRERRPMRRESRGRTRDARPYTGWGYAGAHCASAVSRRYKSGPFGKTKYSPAKTAGDFRFYGPGWQHGETSRQVQGCPAGCFFPCYKGLIGRWRRFFKPCNSAG